MRTWTSEKKPIEMLLFPGAGERPDCALARKFEDAGIGLISVVPDEETEDDEAGARLVCDAVDKFKPWILVGDSRGGRRVLQAAPELQPKELIVACEGWTRVDPTNLCLSPHQSIMVIHSYTDQVFGDKTGWENFAHDFTAIWSNSPIQRVAYLYGGLGTTHGLGAPENQPIFDLVCSLVKAQRRHS